jgi:O-antigen/teichoic acid export membrane protein
MFFTDSERLHQNYIQLIVYILCGLLELIIEPVILYMNLHMENKFLPITISSISRVITNTIFIAIFNMDLWGFTLSRIIGSTLYVSYIFSLGYFKYKLNFYNLIPRDFKSLIFGKSTKSGINVLYLREILYQFIKLNLLNLILSRCQNVVLSFVVKSSDEEKSDYSFISQNYGLITRFLLEPIIDAFYNLVNKIKHIEKKKETIINEEKDIAKENKDKKNSNDSNINIDKELKSKKLEKNDILKKKE